MFKVLAIAAVALAAQDAGQWQDFGAGRDGVRVSVNLDSIETGTNGPEAMIRLRYPRPIAHNVTQADVRGVFDCSSRRVQRFLMNELTASGEIMARSDDRPRTRTGSFNAQFRSSPRRGSSRHVTRVRARTTGHVHQGRHPE